MKELNKFFEKVYKSSNMFNGDFISFDDLTPGTNIMEPKNHKVIGTFIKGISSTDELSEDEYNNTLVTFSDGKWDPLTRFNPFPRKNMRLAFIELSEPRDGYKYGIEIYASDGWGLDSKDFLIATTEDEDFDDRSFDEKIDSMYTPNPDAFKEPPVILPSDDSRRISQEKKSLERYIKSKAWY